MAAALPILSWVLIFAALAKVADVRERALAAALVWGVAVVVLTETTSGLGVLTAPALAGGWAVVALAAAVGARAVRPQPPAAALATAPPRAPDPTANALELPDLLSVAPIVAIVLGTGLLAAVGWPSQWDSMVYHLPRIDHWLQDRSVAFYPTNVVRQLFNPPWSEYAALHLIALGGDERFGSAVAWTSMLGSFAGVSLIARRLGAGARGQVFAVLACATIRMGILQAAGTQNDYVTAFWLVCMAAAVLAPDATAPSGALRIGAALGLAMLTKGTALLFGAPLLGVLWPWTAAPRAHVARGLVLVGLVAALLNAPHWARNVATFGSPLGPESSGSATGGADDALVNQAMSPALLASNLVRNVTIHLGTGIGGLDAAVTALVERGHAAFGLDASDPRTSRFYPEPRFVIDGSGADPDRTGSPVHLVVVLAALLTILASPALRRRAWVARYAVGLVLGFVAFSVVLKYQPWHARLHLPGCVLAAPLAGVAAERWRRRATTVAALALSLLAVQPLLKNALGPLALRYTVFTIPRARQYFHWFGQPTNARLPEYLAAAAVLREAHCADVGLMTAWDDWEHPWWVFVSDEGRMPIRVRHVAVENPSARLGAHEPSFVPCGIIVGSRAVGERLDVAGGSYRLAWGGPNWKVFTTGSSSAAATVR